MADTPTIDAIPAAYADDVTLRLIDERSSTRSFTEGVDITDEQRAAILHAASRAPSAGAMMMYSIIDVRSQETRDRLAVLCDNQPMIAKAPWALVFVVDYAKWIDLFEHAGCFTPSSWSVRARVHVPHRA